MWPRPQTTWIAISSENAATGVLLNDHLLIGPMIHTPLIDVLLFCHHKVAWLTDISKMYRAGLLPEAQCDIHLFRLEKAWVWWTQGVPNDEAHVRCISLLICDECGGKDEHLTEWKDTPMSSTHSWEILLLGRRTHGCGLSFGSHYSSKWNVAAFWQRQVLSQEVEIEQAWSPPSSSWALGTVNNN